MAMAAPKLSGADSTAGLFVMTHNNSSCRSGMIWAAGRHGEKKGWGGGEEGMKVFDGGTAGRKSSIL
ncbi:hypothetical protein TB2_019238 [Malus domestica]